MQDLPEPQTATCYPIHYLVSLYIERQAYQAQDNQTTEQPVTEVEKETNQDD